MEHKLFLKELGNFKYAMLFMLLPISNLLINGFISAAIWTGVLVYIIPPLLAYLLDYFEVGQHSNIYDPSTQHNLHIGAITSNQLHQDFNGHRLNDTSTVLNHGRRSHSHDSNYSHFNDHDDFDFYEINPANGLPMLNSTFDIQGNAYGTNSIDDFIANQNYDSSLDHHPHHDDHHTISVDSNCSNYDDSRY